MKKLNILTGVIEEQSNAPSASLVMIKDANKRF